MPYYDDMTCGGYIKTIRYVGFGPDPPTAVTAMEAADVSGHLDVGVGYLLDKLPDLERHGAGLYRLHVVPTYTVEHLEFNLDPTYNGAPNPLADPNVRLALALAIDRPQLLKDGLGATPSQARGLEAWSILLNARGLRAQFADPQVAGQWDPLARRYLGDTSHAQAVADARVLLGRTRWKHGFTLDFVTLYVPFRKLVAQDIARSWAKLGVHVALRVVSVNDLFGTWRGGGILVHGAFQASLFAWLANTDDPDGFRLDLESRYVARRHPDRAADQDNNYSGLHDPQIDRAFDQAAGTFDRTVRRRDYYLIQERINRAADWVPLYYVPDISTTSPKLQNYEELPVKGEEGLSAYRWKVANPH
jgi:ABC-type transport system substrate-binding protein